MTKFKPPKFESAKAAVWRELEIIRRVALKIGASSQPLIREDSPDQQSQEGSR